MKGKNSVNKFDSGVINTTPVKKVMQKKLTEPSSPFSEITELRQDLKKFNQSSNQLQNTQKNLKPFSKKQNLYGTDQQKTLTGTTFSLGTVESKMMAMMNTTLDSDSNQTEGLHALSPVQNLKNSAKYNIHSFVQNISMSNGCLDEVENSKEKLKEKVFFKRIQQRTDEKKYGKLDYFNEMSSFVRGSQSKDKHKIQVDLKNEKIQKFNQTHKQSVQKQNHLKLKLGLYRNKGITFDYESLYDKASIDSKHDESSLIDFDDKKNHKSIIKNILKDQVRSSVQVLPPIESTRYTFYDDSQVIESAQLLMGSTTQPFSNSGFQVDENEKSVSCQFLRPISSDQEDSIMSKKKNQNSANVSIFENMQAQSTRIASPKQTSSKLQQYVNRSSMQERQNAQVGFVSKIKRQELSPLEKLVVIPANNMTRYKKLQIAETFKFKIFGKLKQHSIETYVDAGRVTYPQIHLLSRSNLDFEKQQTENEVLVQSRSPKANKILESYNFQLASYKALKNQQKKYFWTDSEMEGLVQGTTRNLAPQNNAVLYSNVSLRQLNENDTEVVESNKYVMNEVVNQVAQSVFSTSEQLRFLKFVKNK